MSSLRQLALWGVFLGGCAGPWPQSTLSGSIRDDLTLTNDRIWILSDVVFVEAGATLTIEAGTEIQGAPDSALVITRQAQIDARGTADAPIVFTSNQRGGDRAPGDWGGLVLIGDAVVNEGEGSTEGLDEADPRALYGGTDDENSCGTLQYVRIEFAGFFRQLDSDLNALSLAACGSNTIIEHVQTHLSLDDGIEIVGGTVGLKNVLVTYPNGQGLDWSEGWRGRLQFLIVQHAQDSGSAIEGENNDDELDAEPISAPTLYNVTLMGHDAPETATRGVILRAGTAGILRNSIVSGFSLEAIDIRDEETVDNIENGRLEISNTVLSNIGDGGSTYFDPDDDVDTDDDDFDEEAWFNDNAWENRSVMEDVLAAGLAVVDPLEASELTPTADAFTPALNGPVGTEPAGRLPEDRFWDQSATFVGAVRPGTESGDAWWQGWTDFPVD